MKYKISIANRVEKNRGAGLSVNQGKKNPIWLETMPKEMREKLESTVAANM